MKLFPRNRRTLARQQSSNRSRLRRKLHSSGEEVVARRPIVYQDVNGLRTIIPAAYMLSAGQVCFQVGSYDTSQPLTIDPVVVYSTYLGGTGNNVGHSVAGNVYVTGRTSSTDFPTIRIVLQASFDGHFEDAFVTKLDSEGIVVYSTYLGGQGDNSSEVHEFASAAGFAIAVDAVGNAYVTGSVQSPVTLAGGASFIGFLTANRGEIFFRFR